MYCKYSFLVIYWSLLKKVFLPGATMKKETLCLHAGYSPGNGQPRVAPIVQSTTFKYDSTEEVARLFDLSENGFFYSRLGNPTVDALEKKIAALEGGIGALCASSGQSASLMAFLNIARSGDHILAASSLYGGTFNLLSHRLKDMGIETTFVEVKDPDERIEKAIRPNTRFIFGETIANPALDVLDIERFAGIAHRHGIPLFVDNTFATPILCRPIEHGADIVIHSATKYLDGHAVQLGGVIVDSGRFGWNNGKFPEITEPDESYHGLVYYDAFGPAAFIAKARAQMLRDFGCCLSAQSAFYINLGTETLPLRMRQHSRNALAVARWLQRQSRVKSVTYPGLDGDPGYALAQKYLPEGQSGVISLVLEGGREAGAAFINHLELISLEVHVADIRSCILHPASSTHRQLTDGQLASCGIEPGLLRLSVGLENIDDILSDLRQAMEALPKAR